MRPVTIAVAGCLALLGAACSAIGSGPGQPEGLPHGGTGPFRLLTAAETLISPTPSGSTVNDRERGIENGMAAGGHLFYAGAAPLEIEEPDAGMPDGGVDDGGVAEDAGVPDAGAIDGGPTGPLEVDWSLFEARRIYRSAPRAEGLGFDAGDEVLAADETWEGGFVTDPWALVLQDGRALLYYVAEGGIGVAQAASIDGAFTRTGTRPIIAGDVRRPSVIDTRGTESDHAFLMYFERDGGIVVASSSDGLEFTEIGSLSLPPLAPRDDRDSVEIEIGAPGAIAAQTEAGRAVVRLYYESRRESGQVFVAMVGSFDGLTSFEQVAIPVVDDDDLRWPAPRQLDARISLLYLQTSRRVRGTERGALVVGVAPGGIMLGAPAE